MKLSTLLLSAAAISSALLVMPALAQTTMDSSGNDTQAQGQPFDHPTDDTAYNTDMRDDEKLATAQSQATDADAKGVQYVSGGIADSGMRSIDAEEKHYNLKMLFVAGNGEYVSDVKVNVTDKNKNTVLDTTTNGPVLLIKLPRGKYTVNTQTESGKSLTRKVDISADHLSSYVMRYSGEDNN